MRLGHQGGCFPDRSLSSITARRSRARGNICSTNIQLTLAGPTPPAIKRDDQIGIR
jgi:hypothetical protein